jgi:hypothetical protein
MINPRNSHEFPLNGIKGESTAEPGALPPRQSEIHQGELVVHRTMRSAPWIRMFASPALRPAPAETWPNTHLQSPDSSFDTNTKPSSGALPYKSGID